MNDTAANPKGSQLTEAERKVLEDRVAKTLSPNQNEAVEKSIVKKSKDEEKSKPA